MPGCYAYAYAIDLIDTVYDDSNEASTLGVRWLCGGQGFPENKPFLSYVTHGTLEVWARDTSGNTSSCNVFILVADPGNCDPVYSCYTETTGIAHEALRNTSIAVEGWNCLGDTIRDNLITDNMGYFVGFGGMIMPSPGYYATITPTRSMNPLNGVTTYDLVLIQKHILGIEALSTPYKLIAADANFDGKVNTADIVLLRKLLLGIIPALPHGQSWRFVPKDYVFPNPANPFVPAIPDKYIIQNDVEYLPNSFEFIGVKIGDMNYSANPDN